MSWFDAICHAFSTMGLGGFSTYDASVGYFDSPAVELVLMVFMLIAAMNFARHFLALRRLTLRAVYDRSGSAPMLRVRRRQHRAARGLSSRRAARIRASATTLRHAAFSVVSMATTTGFVTRGLRGVAGVRAATGCCCSPASCATPARPAAASRCSARCCCRGRPARDDACWCTRRRSTRCGSAARSSPIASCTRCWLSSFCTSCTVVALTFAAAAQRARFRQLVQRPSSPPSTTPGPGLGRGRARRATTGPDRFPDLDLHARDAARPPGDLQRAGAVHADVLAQVTPQLHVAANFVRGTVELRPAFRASLSQIRRSSSRPSQKLCGIFHFACCLDHTGVA